MKKNEFLKQLKKEISHLDINEQNDVLSYYSELIDDRIENNQNEEDVIASLGSIEVIAHDIEEERKVVSPNNQSVKKQINSSSSVNIPLIVILILLSPFYIIIPFVIIISFYVVAFSFFGSGIFGLIGSIVQMVKDLPVGVLQLGVSLLLISIGLFLLNALLKLTKIFIKKIISLFEKQFNMEKKYE